MREPKLSPLFTWRTAISESSLPPTARHVALTVSLYMSERGDSAFPSLATLAQDTGLAKSTVTKAIGELEASGYLMVRRAPGGRGGRTRVNHYRATVPREREHDATVQESSNAATSGDGLETDAAMTVSHMATAERRNGSPDERNGSPDAEKRSDHATRERELPRHEDATTLARAPRSQSRDLIWEALEGIYGKAPVGRGFRGKWQSAAGELRAQLVEPEEIPRLVALARRGRDTRWMAATPAALAANLGQLRLLADGGGSADRASEIYAEARRLEEAGL